MLVTKSLQEASNISREVFVELNVKRNLTLGLKFGFGTPCTKFK